MPQTPEELTAEWKAGKLESGLYWVKFKGKIVIAECAVFGDVSKPFKIEKKTDFIIKISKILAPCNYDEYKAMQKELAELKKQKQLADDLYLAEHEKNLNSYEEIYNLKEENKRLLRANWRLVNRENAYYLGKFKELKTKLKTATNTIQSVIDEPGLMDAGMLMFLTSALNKIKE